MSDFEKRFCGNCGDSLPPGVNFCSKCGAIVRQAIVLPAPEPKRRSTARDFAIAIALIIGGYVVLFIVSIFIDATKIVLVKGTLEDNPSARSAMSACQAEMNANQFVVRVGDPQSASKTDAGWRFTFDAVYKSDLGIFEHGTLICNAESSAGSYRASLNRQK